MTVHEPATLLTDFLLAALASWLAWRLPAGPVAARWWGRALGLTALSALVGGCYHGFAPNFSPTVAGPWWLATLLVICLLSAVMALSLLHELRPSVRQREWTVLIAVKLALFAIAASALQKFAVVIIDYGLTMLAWAGAALLLRRAWRGWILAAVGLSAGAALVQQLRWAPSRFLNHNDLYHLIQALALVCFHAAGRKFTVAPLTPAGP